MCYKYVNSKRSCVELREMMASNLFGLGRLGRLRLHGRGRGRRRRRLGFLDPERFFMNVPHLFGSAGVERQHGLAKG